MDERVKKLTELVGGADRLLAMFGNENPLFPSEAMSASSFKELLEEQEDYLL